LIGNNLSRFGSKSTALDPRPPACTPGPARPALAPDRQIALFKMASLCQLVLNVLDLNRF